MAFYKSKMILFYYVFSMFYLSVRGDPSIENISSTICWETKGYEKDCYHSTELKKYADYPITQEMLDRSLLRNTNVEDSALHRAFQVARKRGMLKILVLGGSVTYGHYCVAPGNLSENECAWPNRMQQWFDERIKEFPVEVINAASPAWCIVDVLHDIYTVLPVDMEVDLIIVDYGVNDAVLNKFDDDIENVKLAHEVFILHAQNEMIHNPAILYTEGFIAPDRLRSAPEQSSNMAEIQSEVTAKFKIPMSSFRDAIWPVEEDSSFANEIWGLGIHPSWEVHQIFADVTVYFIQKSYARFLDKHGSLSEPSSEEAVLSSYSKKNVGCPSNSYRLNTTKYVTKKEPPVEQVKSVGWDYTKDAYGRGGLIAYGNSSQPSIVTFDLPCAYPNRVLSFKFLRSYERMGVIRVDITSGDKIKSAIVDGLWKSQSSTLDYERIEIPIGDRSKETVRVTIELLSKNKEKLYSDYLTEVDENLNLRMNRKFNILHMQCC